MKKILLVLLSLIFTTLTFAQLLNPVQWTFSSKKINATTYEVHLTAKIEEGWHLYSQNTPDGGPIPTAINFSKSPLITPTGVAKEAGKMEQHFEELFGVMVKQFSDKVDFIQTVTVKKGVKTYLSGNVVFMTCNDHECLPPKKQPFTVALR
ncbi:MAG: hypothetical protein JWN76_2071 [Chitinophagaceae bacterium]|nr:hypothetical protein [Chitinophagaceae bacterium]